MRFFPRGAFKSLPDTPVQTPVAQVQFQQLQQMQQFQQQIWQQIGTPMAAPRVSILDPMFLYELQILVRQQVCPVYSVLLGDPLQIHPQLSNPLWCLICPGSFGCPGY
jgi:hypothetical protein